MTASLQCPHPSFNFQVNVARIEGDTIHYAHVAGRCEVCGRAVTFRGVPMGMSPHHPTIAPDGQELRVPIVVDGDPVDGMKRRLGFSVNVGGAQ